jgi:nitrogen fixation protein FixH
MPTLLSQPRPRERQISGRMVLVGFVAFFAMVVAVNGVMIRAATSTFGGVETGSAYKAGLAFKHEIAAARAQDARDWQVDGRIMRQGAGEARLEVTARDRAGFPLAGLALTARLSHPTDARRDHAVAVTEASTGLFRGAFEAMPGQWDLVVDLWRADERVFRSKSRVILR